MPERQPRRVSTLSAGTHQPLIGVIFQEDRQEVVRYFADESDADAALPQGAIQRALGLAGAWSDLDWGEMEAGLDRIRHESPPSPPISV